MLDYSAQLAAAGLHKQLCNRLIEPWMFITVIVSATSFDNWFHLRDHKDAQPEIAHIANMMHVLYNKSKPNRLGTGSWHLPFVADVDWFAAEKLTDLQMVSATDEEDEQIVALARKVSVGRCARVSYLTHDGRRDLKDGVVHGLPTIDVPATRAGWPAARQMGGGSSSSAQ